MDTFPKIICSKVNNKAQLGFEHAYYVTVSHISQYAKKTMTVPFFCNHLIFQTYLKIRPSLPSLWCPNDTSERRYRHEPSNWHY